MASDHRQQLEQTAAAMCAPGEGILAADESIGTMSKRLEKAGITANSETRRKYRTMIVHTPNLGEWISGVILSDETFRQADDDGVPIPEVVAKNNMLPGIKVDTGAKPLPFTDGEKVTEGLDGLRDRLAEYVDLGARFAKWRAVIQIDEGIPTETCITANAHALARYAALCQEAGIVPIVEPEVLMDGGHTIEECADVTERMLRTTYYELATQQVMLEGTLLKPNMVQPGQASSQESSRKEVAETTVRVLKRCVPAAVPGINFLSGGQGVVTATEHLQEINTLGVDAPWQLTFSYGRALLDPALSAWQGEDANVEVAQQALAQRARLNAAAREGKYDSSMEES